MSSVNESFHHKCILFQEVTIVIYDDPTYDIFEKALQSFNTSAQSRYTPVQARRYLQQDPFQSADPGAIRFQNRLNVSGIAVPSVSPSAYDSLPRPVPRKRVAYIREPSGLKHVLSQPSRPDALPAALRQRSSSSEKPRGYQNRDEQRQHKARGKNARIFIYLILLF